APTLFHKVALDSSQIVGILLRGTGEVECRPAEHAGGDVAEALDRVAPAAVRVLMGRQPGKAIGDELVVRPKARLLLDEGESTDRGGSGESRGGEFAGPVAVGVAFGEEST